MTKKELRKYIRNLRKSLSPDERHLKSTEIAERLFSLDVYQEAKAIMAYASYGSEVETSLIISKAMSDGKMVSLPKVEGDFMLFIENNENIKLAPGYANIPEPEDGDIFDPEKFEGSILMLMPGVGFDPDRNRIGQGGGFYDRFLATHKNIKTVAVSFDCQIVEHIITEATDMKPDFIVTESRVIS